MRRTLLAPRAGGLPTSLRRLIPLAAMGAALALSGCQTQSPIQTDVPYQAADGVPVDLGSVQIRDLVVVAAGKDKPGVLSGSLVNTSGSEQRVGFALQTGSPVFVTAPAHSAQRLSQDTQVQLPSIPAAPGDVVTMTVQSPTAPAAVTDVPVVPASGYYAGLGATSQSSASATSAP